MEITIDAFSEAFGEAFRQEVIPNPERLDFWLENRHQIDRPIYVRRMIGAMSSRIEAQDFTCLDRWLEFCEWVLSHPDRKREASLQPGDRLRENPYWGNADARWGICWATSLRRRAWKTV